MIRLHVQLWAPPTLAAAFLILVPTLLLWPTELDIPLRQTPRATPVSLRPTQTIDAALSAPLFNINRSPAAQAEEVGSIEPQSAEATAPPPSIVGVIIRRAGGGVVLARKADGDTVTARIGETVDGWRLTGIRGDSALFERGDRRASASLDYSNKPTRSDAVPAALPQPGSSDTDGERGSK